LTCEHASNIDQLFGEHATTNQMVATPIGVQSGRRFTGSEARRSTISRIYQGRGRQVATTRKKKASKKNVSKKKPLKQPKPGKQSLSDAPAGDEDWEAKEVRWKAILVDRAKRAVALRSEDREFHGLEREFHNHQAQMLLDYEKTKDLKHPRDLGDSREQILRRFLALGGCLPGRYAVSDRSVRVVSTSGHMSREIDIALYDRLDAITLMNREDIYQALPLENVYGVIQVKSRLNAATIKDGLKNLASFKSLSRQAVPTPKFGTFMGPKKSERGFGLLFAYDSDLSLVDIMAEVKKFAATRQPRDWANLVFVLNKGFVFHGEANTVCYTNEAIEKIQSLQMQGRPDRDSTGLYSFYSLLLELLRGTETSRADVDAYLRLPMVAGDYSYRFIMGMFREFGVCPEHGDYGRKIAADQLERVITWCRSSKPINWIRAHHIAYGKPEDEAAYSRQPGDVYI
jgi:hypothetical protein